MRGGRRRMAGVLCCESLRDRRQRIEMPGAVCEGTDQLCCDNRPACGEGDVAGFCAYEGEECG